MNALGIIITSLLGIVVLAGSRQIALTALMAAVLYLTQFQQVNILGFNLFAIRFLEISLALRVFIRQEYSAFRVNGIDRALVTLYVFTTCVFLLRSDENQAYVIGNALDAHLCYFGFRCLIRDLSDLRWLLKSLVFLLTPYVFILSIEHHTAKNPFAVLGAIENDVFRDNGTPRCAGSFRYASLLGTFGAGFLPLYMALMSDKATRTVAAIGMSYCLLIVFFSNSGGPISATAAALLAWAFWPFRTNMKLVRRSIVALIALAAVVMKAPVWFLIGRFSDLTGGDGWHRSYLIDVSLRHLNEWWFAGMTDEATSSWFGYVVRRTGAADITNAYIAFGLTAGLGSVILFIYVLTKAYSALGKAMHRIRADQTPVNNGEKLLWGLGAMLTVHVVNWFGVTYWDQTYLVWFCQLAAISGVSAVVVVNSLNSKSELISHHGVPALQQPFAS